MKSTVTSSAPKRIVIPDVAARQRARRRKRLRHLGIANGGGRA